MMESDLFKLDLSIYPELKDHIDEIMVLGKLLDYEIDVDDHEADPFYIEDRSLRSLTIYVYNSKVRFWIQLLYWENKIARYFMNAMQTDKAYKSIFKCKMVLEFPIEVKVEITQKDFEDMYVGLQKFKEHL